MKRKQSDQPAVTTEDVQFITPREAASILRLTPNTLAKLRYENKGPVYYKPTGVVRYKLSDIKEWQDRSAVVPTGV